MVVGFAVRNPKPNSGNERTKSVSRSGNTDRGKGLVWSSIEAEKPRGSAFGYVYPAVDYQVWSDLMSNLDLFWLSVC